MLDEDNLVTYSNEPSDIARRTMRVMTEAIRRGDLNLHTALHPSSDLTAVDIIPRDEHETLRVL